MLSSVYLKSFEKEIARDKRRGKNLANLRKVMKMIIYEEPLPPKYRNHKLKGEFEGYWECHVEPDWLLLYKKTGTHVYFARTGTHSDLF